MDQRHAEHSSGITRPVLITGAAGAVGTILRQGLPGLGWQLRCFDVAPPDPPDDVPWLLGDISDRRRLVEAMRGAGAVIHLAGIPHEADFPRLLHTNIDGTYQVFEAAREAGVTRVLYASSNHAVGRYTADTRLSDSARPRPDSLYGVSKAFGEALGSYYADRFGMRVACVRIGSCFAHPTQLRHLATRLSPGDAVLLFAAPGLRFATVNGISANIRAWWDLDGARALGCAPQDDEEGWARDLLARHGGELAPDDPDATFVGGRMTAGR
ncbi:NAD-dependent epimerase/dehydratase family protein [Streptomyces brasiliensis]|uniref:NAD-dependent dehydratase n=1 Tax=Streptomyces brasiliensis TaxID=1954 RepID=A0A917LCI2_9ACTN|nr:NAD(P)-dependent oxidoreductase [Streptomyces brasiliensis]GGJ59407.1 NAD-dependent dehydratase [Streptomyces brasiliensis]